MYLAGIYTAPPSGFLLETRRNDEGVFFNYNLDPASDRTHTTQQIVPYSKPYYFSNSHYGKYFKQISHNR